MPLVAPSLETVACALTVAVVLLWVWGWAKKHINAQPIIKERFNNFGPYWVMAALGFGFTAFVMYYGSHVPPTDYQERHHSIQTQISQIHHWADHTSLGQRLFVNDDERLELANEINTELLAAIEEYNQLMRDYQTRDPILEAYQRTTLIAVLWIVGICGVIFGAFGVIAGIIAIDD